VTQQRTATSVPRELQIVLVCAGLLVVAIAGYFLLISSKRSEAKDLRAETAKVQEQVDRNRTTAYAKALPAAKAATVYRLAQAMPSDVEMSNVILQLNQIAEDSGISFDEITPQAPTQDTNYDVHPITVVFTGNYYNLEDFLLRVRNLVRVHDGKLISDGRMFAVAGVTFAEAEKKFPYVTATLTIDAFVLGSAQSAAPVAPTTSGTSTTTTSTTTTSTSPTTTTPSS
jgi:Tfp pilus assembly protein PilO